MASSMSIRNSKTQHTVIETAPKATLLMLLAGLFILILGALCIHNTSSPTFFSAPIAYFALYSGCLLGGVFCSLRLDENLGIVCALISALLLCSLIILAKAFITTPEKTNVFLISLITHLLIPLFSAVGALTGRKYQKNKVHQKRKKNYRSKK